MTEPKPKRTRISHMKVGFNNTQFVEQGSFLDDKGQPRFQWESGCKKPANTDRVLLVQHHNKVSCPRCAELLDLFHNNNDAFHKELFP